MSLERQKRDRLFGRGKTGEAPTPHAEGPAPAPPVTEPAAPDDPLRISLDPEGHMVKLWRRWEGSYPRPDLVMDCGGREEALLPGKLAMAQERLRMKLNIEREARTILGVVGELEKAEERRRQARLEKLAGMDPEAAAKEPPEEEFSLNAACLVFTTVTKMAAWMLLIPPCGPEGELLLEDMRKAVKESGVVHGLLDGVLEELHEEPEYFKLVLIAAGTPPEEGEDGRIVELFKRELPREVVIDENGRANYKAEYLVQIVEQGQAICDIIPPREGTSGMRVDGGTIPARKVKPAKAPGGANTKLNEDKTQLVSTINGHVEFSRDCFNVKPVLEIQGDVDYSSGNIDFWGDVHIHGDVRENFMVHATGTVTIDGLVESATVDAGGDVMVACGVLGDNRALVKCGGKLQAKYLENCVAYAGESVCADCIMNSQIFSDGTIDVTSGRGTIIGGALTAAQGIKAKIIGTQSGRGTEILLGMLPYVQSELLNIEADLEAVEEEMERLEKDLTYLAGREGMEGTSERAAKARLRKSVLTMKLQKLLRDQEKLKVTTPDLSKCRLEASVLYPPTVVEVQGCYWRAQEVRNHLKLGFDPEIGEIYER